jgi:hypothetical protein
MFISKKHNLLVTGDDGVHGRARPRRLRGPRGWALLGAVAVAASSAAGVIVLEAGTVFAPEPVVTTQTLTGSNGATADAVYQNSGTPTSVIKWYTNYIYAPWLAAGTPCSPTALAVDQVATKVIIASGNYRRCG